MRAFISRRQVVASGAGFLCVTGIGKFESLSAGEPYADAQAADDWLKPLVHAPGASSGALHMGRFRDRIYYLDQPIQWEPGPGQKGPKVQVPAGFVTDLASIPRIFWSLLPTDGVYTFPAIVHDYMYWTQEHVREIADSVFEQGMDDMKISAAISKSIYLAVRAGGGEAWSENAKRRKGGEKRMLREFPKDPATTWEDWKTRPNCCAKI